MSSSKVFQLDTASSLPSPPPSPPTGIGGRSILEGQRLINEDIEKATGIQTGNTSYPKSKLCPTTWPDTGNLLITTIAIGRLSFIVTLKTHESALSRLRKRGRKARPVEDFYELQNQHINNLLKSLDEDAREANDATQSSATHVRIAIQASFIVNCLLAALQLYAAISSLSLSFFATALDAVFDPCANFALNYAHRYANKVDLRKYPSGGSRFETIGNIIYSGVMGCASVVLVVESIESLAKGRSIETDNKLHIPAIAAVSASFVAKGLLFIYCWAVRNQDGQVRVLWEDHRNDLFINAFGIFTNAAGAKIKWWIDPLGAMLISIALIILWGFKQLAGESAPVDFMQRVVYKAMTFSQHIEKIDSCKCYHVGPNYFVEIDIVIDGNTPLWLAHDLGQELQDKLEALPNVDRAFVHLDHEVDHKPEHARYK
ncbi:hypothetical protein PSTT_10365 [Puccinia striiformis]|uniref:Uncharacterized protein n=1 Tax=Puccinia striiformis TaxID=27350 RepID=A0A2S4V4H5_9BASI|nr:hypothetical protein PSTT_10365 [Puccinia striiformis]